MSAPLRLLAYSLKRVRTLVLTTGFVLGGFQLILIGVAKSIHLSGGFSQLARMLPSFAREVIGPSMATFMSFAGFVCIGYFHLAVMGSLVAMSIALATLPVSEMETGFMDLLLSRPLPRHWIVTRTIAIIILCIAVLLGCLVLGTWIGLETMAPKNAAWPSRSLIGSLVLNLALLLLCWAGIAMAIGAAARRRGAAGAITGLLALIAFLLDYVGRMWKPAQSVAWLSPFRYYESFSLLLGEPIPSRNLIVLGSVATAGFIAGYWLFSRRDIAR